MVLLSISPVLAFAQTELININTATAAEFDTLPGIGPAYAQRIIDYRSANGPFSKTEDIQKVSGIGPSTYADIKDLITVGQNIKNTQNQPINNSQTIQVESGHYSATPVTAATPKSPPTVGAGRDRIGVVGSPLEFKAEAPDSTISRENSFRWNYGDGSEGGGQVVTHVYDYPGEYIVILNASFPNGEAVTRVNVKIVDPEITVIAATTERIELKNNSKYEVNLFGRALIVGGRAFVFSKDTIIKAGQSISFSSKVTGLYPGGVADVEVMILGETENSKITAKIEKHKAEKINYIKSQISTLQQRLTLLPKTDPKKEEIYEANIDSNNENLAGEEKLNQSAAVKSGWLGMLMRFLLKTNK